MLNTSDKGTRHELVVCVDLMAKGYEMYKAMSPGASCDLIAVKGGKIIRVEVATATGYLRDGRIAHSHLYDAKRNKTNRYDLLAIVFRDSMNITYQPALEE